MTAAGRAPRGACLGKETGRLPLEPSNPRRPVPVHPECAAGRRGPPPAVHSGVRVKVWEKPGGDEGSGFQGTRWQNRVHVPVQADAWGDELGGAPPPAHTATGEPRPRVLTAAWPGVTGTGRPHCLGLLGDLQQRPRHQVPEPLCLGGPRKAHTSCVPGPGGGAQLCARRGAGQRQRPWAEAGTSHTPTLHQSPDKCPPGSQPGGLSGQRHSSQRLTGAKPTAHRAERGRTRQLEPSDALGKPRPSGPQPAHGEGSLRPRRPACRDHTCFWEVQGSVQGSRRNGVAPSTHDSGWGTHLAAPSTAPGRPRPPKPLSARPGAGSGPERVRLVPQPLVTGGLCKLRPRGHVPPCLRTLPPPAWGPGAGPALAEA